MPIFSRRDFLKTGSALAGMALTGLAFSDQEKLPLLSFSTLGCPDWPFEKIINFAAENNFDAIEMRGILRQLDLTKCSEFNSKENIRSTLKKVQGKQLKFSDLGSSVELHHPESAIRQKNLDDAKRYIDLAQQLNCPYIRVFPNELPKNQERDATIDLIIDGLLKLGAYAQGSHVTVLMESHGELTRANDLEKIMRAAEHTHVGMIWDIVNMWSVTKEPPAEVYAKLKKYICHIHLKDLKMIDGKARYVLLGQGETPILEAVDILRADGFLGYYSFEWEKLWHPEIDAPEIAIADYSKVMRAHFKI
jgi:sugar phosphate isomerase/epimerase